MRLLWRKSAETPSTGELSISRESRGDIPKYLSHLALVLTRYMNGEHLKAERRTFRIQEHKAPGHLANTALYGIRRQIINTLIDAFGVVGADSSEGEMYIDKVAAVLAGQVAERFNRTDIGEIHQLISYQFEVYSSRCNDLETVLRYMAQRYQTTPAAVEHLRCVAI